MAAVGVAMVARAAAARAGAVRAAGIWAVVEEMAVVAALAETGAVVREKAAEALEVAR